MNANDAAKFYRRMQDAVTQVTLYSMVLGKNVADMRAILRSPDFELGYENDAYCEQAEKVTKAINDFGCALEKLASLGEGGKY